MTSSTYHPIDSYMGQRLRMRRAMLGMTQAELGDAIGLSFQQIQKYENGKNRMAVSTLWRIAKALNVSPDYFWRGFEEDEDEPQS